MKSKPFRRARNTAAMLLALTTLTALAQIRPEIRSREFTDGEWALLPEWCIDSQQGPYGGPEYAGLNKSPRAAQWLALMGTDFWHMHHYCRGLNDLNRLKRADLTPRERVALTETAISEFNYVIRTCQPTMPLMPEVFLHLGDVHLMRNELGAANAAFERSRQLKPDYWPAYSRWAEVLIGLKQFERARALLEQGLGHSPNQPVLLQMLRQAGGKVTPVTTPAAAAPATTAAVAQPSASAPP